MRHTRHLRGLGDGSTYCFDANGDAIDCSSPDAYNSVVLTAAQQAASDAATGTVTPPANTVIPLAPAGSPYSYQAAPGIVSSISSLLAPARPSPVLNVPLTSSSAGMFLTSGTLGGFPVWEIAALLGAVLILPGLFAAKKRRR